MSEIPSSRVFVGSRNEIRSQSYLKNPSIAAVSHASPIPTPVLNLQTPLNFHTPVNSQTPVPTVLTTQSTSRVPVASASVLQKQSKHSLATSAYHIAPTTYQTVEPQPQRNATPINHQNVSPTPFQVISSSYAANPAAVSGAGSPYRASSTPFFGTSQFQHFTSQAMSPTQQSVPFHTSLSPSGLNSKSFDTDDTAIAAAAAAVVAAAAKTSSFVKQQLHQYPPGTVSTNKIYREISSSRAAVAAAPVPVVVQPTISSAVPRPQSQTPVSLASFNKFARSYPVRSSQQPSSLASTPAELGRILPPQSPQSVQSSPDITSESRSSSSTPSYSDPQFRPQLVLDSVSNTRKWKDNFEQYRVRQYDIYHITIRGPINELELIPLKNNEFNVVVN